AKETFTRRFTCSALCVAETANILVSPMVDGDQNAYDLVDENVAADGQGKTYEIYHLLKRGRQHIHAGNVNATTHAHALARAKQASGGKKVLNIWVLRTQDIRFTTPE